MPTVSSKWNVGFQAQEQLRTVLLTEWKAAIVISSTHIVTFLQFAASIKDTKNIPPACFINNKHFNWLVNSILSLLYKL
jgi:hypothetical protein